MKVSGKNTKELKDKFLGPQNICHQNNSSDRTIKSEADLATRIKITAAEGLNKDIPEVIGAEGGPQTKIAKGMYSQILLIRREFMGI